MIYGTRVTLDGNHGTITGDYYETRDDCGWIILLDDGREKWLNYHGRHRCTVISPSPLAATDPQLPTTELPRKYGA